MENILEFTNRISVPQILAVVGAVFFILEYFRRQLFKFLLDWRKGQIDNQIELKRYLDAKLNEHNDILQDKLDVQSNRIEACIHQTPNHPENPNA